MTFIGIDVGTTRTKAVLYDPQSSERRVTAEPTPVVSTPHGDFRDADAVAAAVLSCIDRLLDGLLPAERGAVRGIGITSLSEEMVLLDASGRSASPMPAWYTTVAAEAARDEGIDPSFSWSKLRWASEHRAAADIRGVTTLNSYIAAALGDHSDFAVDHSHASRTGFFDVGEGTWQTQVFEATGWNASLLPRLVPAGSAVSTLASSLAARWGIPNDAVIVLGGHDHFCGAFAVGIRSEGQLYVSAGTSEAHCLIVDELPRGILPEQVGAGRFVDGEHFYLHRQLPSGHLYRQWTGLLGLADDSFRGREDEELRAEPLGSLGITVVPGFGTDVRSSVFDVAPNARSRTLLRALLEGLACAALLVDRELIALTGRPITDVVASGIPAASPVWQQLRANPAVAPLSVSSEDEAPALGAALLCERAVTGTEARPSALQRVPADASSASEYEALYARFEQKLSTLS